jgi:DNA-binding transcriptional regulator YhcF (GntR family)
MVMANSFNVNIDGVDRLMTDDEKDAFLEWQKQKLAIIKSNKQQVIDKENAKQVVLDKLGLTADEAAALLG